jgi:hypothetical protein
MFDVINMSYKFSKHFDSMLDLQYGTPITFWGAYMPEYPLDSEIGSALFLYQKPETGFVTLIYAPRNIIYFHGSYIEFESKLEELAEQTTCDMSTCLQKLEFKL